MTALVAALSGVFGLIIGSFLNVVIYRVPRGESVVRPRSRCPECETPIEPRDNIPVVSWLLLKGRCRHCGTPISPRYPIVEFMTGALFAGLALKFGAHVVLPAYLYLGAVGVALAAIDLDTKRLPNALTLPSYPVALALLGIAAAVDGTAADYVRALIGMAALFAFYFLLVLIYPAGMGMGDVKLSGVLGLYLGYLGVGSLVVGAFLGFLLGGVVSIGLVLFSGAGRKTKIPFGPFMISGALVAVFAGHALADAYTSFTVG